MTSPGSGRIPPASVEAPAPPRRFRARFSTSSSPDKSMSTSPVFATSARFLFEAAVAGPPAVAVAFGRACIDVSSSESSMVIVSAAAGVAFLEAGDDRVSSPVDGGGIGGPGL